FVHFPFHCQLSGCNGSVRAMEIERRYLRANRLNQNIGRITCHAVPLRRFSSTWIEVVIISVAVGAVTARRVVMLPNLSFRRACHGRESPFSLFSSLTLKESKSCCIK